MSSVKRKTAFRFPIFPMPRSAFVLLMVSVALSVLPHLPRLPVWMLPVMLVIIVWRIQIFRQRVKFPGRVLRLLLVSIAFCSMVYHHGTLFGPDAGVGLLVTAYVFKLLEMYSKRDAFLVVILAYFVLATELLFSFSFFMSAYIVLVLLCITAALIALNQTDSTIAVWMPLKTSVLYFLQAVPLLVVLSLLFPRIGPLWQLNLSSNSAAVGLSEKISPGDIANLSRSEKLAFRVEFEGDIPPYRDRYWRAAVFDRFDGRTWYAQNSQSPAPLNRSEIRRESKQYRYRVFLEATGQRWLMSMPYAEIKGLKYFSSAALMNFNPEPINSSLTYDVVSYPDFQYQSEQLLLKDIQKYTALPASTDPVTRDYAKTLYDEVGRRPQQFSEKILRWFFKENFVYSLTPPLLGQHTIDDFLFKTRTGFCSHFAGAYVFMLRSVGIPARMVGGYQGGDLHPIGNYLLVHQYEAHAWVEYWIQGQGWIRVDPTAAVAPHRIESGPLGEASHSSFLAESPLSPDRFRNIELISRIRILVDYMDYLWVKNVVSYDADKQSDLFARLLGKVTPQRIALLLGVAAGGVLLMLAMFILLSRKRSGKLDRVDRALLRFVKKMNRVGLSRKQGEGIDTFFIRIVNEKPEYSQKVNKMRELYDRIKYSNFKKSTNLTPKTTNQDDTLRRYEVEFIKSVDQFKS